MAITPAAGSVTPLAALVIGALAAPISYDAIQFIKGRELVDESLDVFACHCLGGLWGALATGPHRLLIHALGGMLLMV